MPIFSSTPARITDPAVGASVCASGSQVCSGNSGTLTANAAKNARNSTLAVPSERPPGAHAVSVRRSNVSARSLGVQERERQQPDEQERRAEPPCRGRT